MKKIGLTFVSHGVGQLITYIIQFFQIPVIVTAIGVESAGDWFLISAIPMFFVLLDFGISSTAGNRAIKALVAGDEDLSKEIFCTMRRVNYGLLTSCLMLGGLAFFLDVGLVITHSSSLPVSLLFGMLIANVGAQFILSNVKLFYRVKDNTAKGLYIANVHRLVTSGLFLCLVYLTGDITLASGALLVASLSLALVPELYISKSLKTNVVAKRYTKAMIREDFLLGSSSMLPNVAQAIIVNIPTVILGRLAPSTTAVAEFVAARTISRSVHQLQGTCSLSFQTEVARIPNEKFVNQFRNVAIKVTLLYFAVGGVALAVIYIARTWLEKFWLAGQVSLRPEVVAALIFGVVLWNIHNFVISVLIGRSLHRLEPVVQVMVAILSVAAFFAAMWSGLGLVSSLIIAAVGDAVYSLILVYQFALMKKK